MKWKMPRDNLRESWTNIYWMNPLKGINKLVARKSGTKIFIRMIYYGGRRGHTYMDCVVHVFALIEECRSVYQAEYLGTFQQGNLLGRTRSDMGSYKSYEIQIRLLIVLRVLYHTERQKSIVCEECRGIYLLCKMLLKMSSRTCPRLYHVHYYFSIYEYSSIKERKILI